MGAWGGGNFFFGGRPCQSVMEVRNSEASGVQSLVVPKGKRHEWRNEGMNQRSQKAVDLEEAGNFTCGIAEV